MAVVKLVKINSAKGSCVKRSQHIPELPRNSHILRPNRGSLDLRFFLFLDEQTEFPIPPSHFYFSVPSKKSTNIIFEFLGNSLENRIKAYSLFRFNLTPTFLKVIFDRRAILSFSTHISSLKI